MKFVAVAVAVAAISVSTTNFVLAQATCNPEVQVCR